MLMQSKTYAEQESATERAEKLVAGCVGIAVQALGGKDGKVYVNLATVTAKCIDDKLFVAIQDPFLGHWSAEVKNEKITRLVLVSNPLEVLTNRCVAQGLYLPSFGWMSHEKALSLSLSLQDKVVVTPQRDRYKDRSEAYLAKAMPGETCFEACGIHEAEAFLVYSTTHTNDAERFTSLDEALAHLWADDLA